MKDIRRFTENMGAIIATIQKNAPRGSGFKYDYDNIHAEHYGRINQNRIIFDNCFDCVGTSLFVRITIGSDLVPKIIIKGADSRDKRIIKSYNIRKSLQDRFQRWIDEDEELLELLARVF